jgi:hypothetical protein
VWLPRQERFRKLENDKASATIASMEVDTNKLRSKLSDSQLTVAKLLKELETLRSSVSMESRLPVATCDAEVQTEDQDADKTSNKKKPRRKLKASVMTCEFACVDVPMLVETLLRALFRGGTQRWGAVDLRLPV